MKPLGARSILTTWEKPEDPQGIVRSYHINYTRIGKGHLSLPWCLFIFFLSDLDGRPRETYSALIKERNFHHIWNDHDGVEVPKPQTKYRVSIAAETGCLCLGAVTSQTVETYPEARKYLFGSFVWSSMQNVFILAPSKPGLTAEPIGYTAANVTWVWPEDGMPGTAFYVNYSLTGMSFGQALWLRPYCSSVSGFRRRRLGSQWHCIRAHSMDRNRSTCTKQ